MFDIGPTKPTNVFFSAARRDGKHKVVFAFYSRKMTKIITAEELESYRADSAYNVVRSAT